MKAKAQRVPVVVPQRPYVEIVQLNGKAVGLHIVNGKQLLRSKPKQTSKT